MDDPSCPFVTDVEPQGRHLAILHDVRALAPRLVADEDALSEIHSAPRLREGARARATDIQMPCVQFASGQAGDHILHRRRALPEVHVRPGHDHQAARDVQPVSGAGGHLQ